MSTVIRPSGPLPPRIYWVRRLLVLLVLVVVISLLWWLVSAAAGDAQDERSAAPAGTSSTTDGSRTTSPPDDETPTTDKRPATTTPRTPKPPRSPTESTTPTTPTTPTKTPLAESTGDCTPAGVDIDIEVTDVKAGRSTTATLVLTSTDTPACTLSITPSTLLVKVTSGADTVWSSDDCPDALRAKRIVVRADPATEYVFGWNGKRSADGCQPDPGAVEPGGYWVQAALIGGEPHEAYFDLT